MDNTEGSSSPLNSVDFVHDADGTEVEDYHENEKAIVLSEDTDDDSDLHNDTETTDLNKAKQKKRNLKALYSEYEFAPRAVVTPPVAKASHGGRNSLTDWTEEESFALLNAWGQAYVNVKHGRKSVSSKEWQEVAVKVSAVSRFRTETQCRNRLDTLKKKYKKEKALQAENEDFVSKCVYFNKMDMLISPKQGNGDTGDCFGNGFGNGAIVAYVHPVNAYSSDETKDGEAKDDEGNDNAVGDDVGESAKPEGSNNNGPPKKKKAVSGKCVGEDFKLLADSIEKFSTMYERMEMSKMDKVAEIEKTRMEFRRDVEVLKGKMLRKNQVEIAKIWGVTLKDNDDNNNTSSDM